MDFEFKPFKDEAACLELTDKKDNTLTIENHLDAIALFGSVYIARDDEGRAIAVELKNLMEAIIAEIDSGSKTLPPAAETDSVRNPF